MSKFKITFNLKQHTPLIHFQHDQTGATLRASELKPRFDSYLLSKKESIPFKETHDGSRFLDYKIKILPLSTPQVVPIPTHSLYFGNMGDGEDKKFVNTHTSIKVEFFSYDHRILETINTYFEAFLANHNFGTRQSKGYGGFYLDKAFDTTLIDYKVYRFESKNWEKDIRLFYQFLRQGINLPRPNNKFYTKPAIFAYAKKMGWQWEKKTIKEQYFSNDLDQQKSVHRQDIVTYSSQEKYILRDLFGLSSSQDWKSYKNAKIEKTHTNEKQEIQRFKSPITFKIINNGVYFWANDSYNKILGETFKIQNKQKGDLTLSTPKVFSFDDFFDYTFNTLNLSKHVDDSYHKVSEYITLQRIIESIKDHK